MIMHFEYDIEGGDFSKAGNVSSLLKKTLKQLVGNHKIVKRIVVSMYEAEVNVVAHAYSGKVIIDIDTDKISIQVKDKGPGIEDIEQAMQDGYSTASEQVREMGFGAGMGLSNIKNNSDEFELTSTVGEGTELKIVAYLKNL
ncbi:MAG TPA: ATP-binding protein [Bacteroidales bacterium]|jgi:anti-sigma regulatory factor (Ser/Thr protein kinase)|nr:ATP-binding protein [Bacteroidales bacterium]